MVRCRKLPMVLAFWLTLQTSQAVASPHLLGQFPARHAAFVRLVPGQDTRAQELIVSGFGVLGGDAVSRVSLNQANLEQVADLRLQTISNQVVWPNEVIPVPPEIFGSDYLAVATGFLIPGRSTGEVLIANIYSGEQFAITARKPGYFYHRVEWLDMNGDGRLDALTARAKKYFLGGGTGELVWFEQPEDDRRQPWTEHVIATGPDVHFIVADLSDDGQPEIIATEFFGRQLTVRWSEQDVWQTRVIDAMLGNAFDLVLTDLNLDGRKDIVVTNHESGNGGAVLAYEVPNDFKLDPWPRHTLLAGIEVVLSSFNAAAPGAPVVWTPAEGGKPRVLVGGDGSGKLHMLVPVSRAAKDWRYREEVLLETNSTIGRIWLGELASNWLQHLFVPSYDESKIYVFRLD